MLIWYPGNPNGTFKCRWHMLSESAFRGLLNNLAARERKAISGPKRARWRERRFAAVAHYRSRFGETDVLSKFAERHCAPRYPYWFPLRKSRRKSSA
jgi:hypothetical protein